MYTHTHIHSIYVLPCKSPQWSSGNFKMRFFTVLLWSRYSAVSFPILLLLYLDDLLFHCHLMDLLDTLNEQWWFHFIIYPVKGRDGLWSWHPTSEAVPLSLSSLPEAILPCSFLSKINTLDYSTGNMDPATKGHIRCCEWVHCRGRLIM